MLMAWGPTRSLMDNGANKGALRSIGPKEFADMDLKRKRFNCNSSTTSK